MTTLKTATLWCCSLKIPWRAEDVADMSGNHLGAVRAYLNRLADANPPPIRRLEDGTYAAGDPAAIKALRIAPTQAKDGGNGASYRRGKAARDRLLAQEGAARRQGGFLTPQTYPNLPKPTQTTQPDFSAGALTPEQTQRVLSVGRETLRRYVKKGLLPSGLLPTGHRRFGAADVQRFLNQQIAGVQL